MVDTKIRSVFKAISWRLTATFTTICVAFIVTGKVDTALLIGGIEGFIKIIIYYCHERIWEKVKFGRKPPPDYQI